MRAGTPSRYSVARMPSLSRSSSILLVEAHDVGREKRHPVDGVTDLIQGPSHRGIAPVDPLVPVDQLDLEVDVPTELASRSCPHRVFGRTNRPAPPRAQFALVRD